MLSSSTGIESVNSVTASLSDGFELIEREGELEEGFSLPPQATIARRAATMTADNPRDDLIKPPSSPPWIF